LQLHTPNVDGALAGVTAFIINIQRDKGIDGLLQEQTPKLVLSGFQTVQHLVSDYGEIISREIIIDKGEVRAYRCLVSLPLKCTCKVKGFEEFFTICPLFLAQRRRKFCLHTFGKLVSGFRLGFKIIQNKITGVKDLRSVFNMMQRVFPIEAEAFRNSVTYIQEMRVLVTFFITEVSIYKIIIGDKTVVSVPARLISWVKLCRGQEILVFQNLTFIFLERV